MNNIANTIIEILNKHNINNLQLSIDLLNMVHSLKENPELEAYNDVMSQRD